MEVAVLPTGTGKRKLKGGMYLFLILFFVEVSFCVEVNALGREVISLAKKGKANYVIVSPPNASECEKFAAQELKKFLFQISEANFEIKNKIRRKSIVVSTCKNVQMYCRDARPCVSTESYSIFKQGESIYLTGTNPRATLYAVYDFLNQLGCLWVAPDFDFFSGTSCNIPQKKNIDFVYSGFSMKTPSLKYRKLYVEEGKSHTLQNLRQLIDWMPKARFNVLVIPYNYQGSGRVKWDHWREELLPELKKRGIIIEVGGHGYQNLLNAGMEEGKLFLNHPEWFGQDQAGNRSKDQRMVVCTSNPDAVNYLYGNLLHYLKAHPEVEIFDFWPPDMETWCQCDKCKAMGSETERHILLVNRISELLQKDLPNVTLECIAYSKYTSPPSKVALDKKVLLDFCPINQCFEYQIYEPGASQNKEYHADLLKWKEAFAGDVSIYSYYRKYAWHSLPNIIPHYMQNDLKYYQSIGLKGISVYSEPGDWFTYGINHYVLSQLGWNPDVNVDNLIEAYTTQIYGRAAPAVISVYRELEDVVRFACDLPYTTVKAPEQYKDYFSRITACRQTVKSAMKENSTDSLIFRNLLRLDLMLEYANRSILLMNFKSNGDSSSVARLDQEIKGFLKEHKGMGVVIP